MDYISSQFEGLIQIVIEGKGPLCPFHPQATQHRTGRNKGSQLSNAPNSIYLPVCVGLNCLIYPLFLFIFGPCMVFVRPRGPSRIGIIVLFLLLLGMSCKFPKKGVYERARQA